MVDVLEQEIDAYDYGKVRYQPNPQHRDQNPNKSQWEISVEHEIYVFQCAAFYHWIASDKAWALFIFHYFVEQSTKTSGIEMKQASG